MKLWQRKQIENWEVILLDPSGFQVGETKKLNPKLSWRISESCSVEEYRILAGNSTVWTEKLRSFTLVNGDTFELDIGKLTLSTNKGLIGIIQDIWDDKTLLEVLSPSPFRSIDEPWLA